MAELIVALDVSSASEADAVVTRLGPAAVFYKIGLELFSAEGPDVVARVKGKGKSVFLDLKLHDIPRTVERAVKSCAGLGVDLLTIHSSGGRAMIRAAADAAASCGGASWPSPASPASTRRTWPISASAAPCPSRSPRSVRSPSAPVPMASSVRRRKSLPCAGSSDRPPCWSRPAYGRPDPRLATRSASPRLPRLCATAPRTSLSAAPSSKPPIPAPRQGRSWQRWRYEACAIHSGDLHI